MNSPINLAKIALIFGIIGGLNAAIPPLKELQNAPKSLAKDYYIYRYSKEKTASKKTLNRLRPQIMRYAGVIAKEFDKKLGKLPPTPTKEQLECAQYSIDALLTAPKTCQNMMINQNLLSKLTPQNRAELASVLSPLAPQIAHFITAYDEPEPLIYLAKMGDEVSFLRYLSSQSDKAKSLSHKEIPGEFLAKILENWQIKPLIKKTVILGEHPEFAKKLLEIPPHLSKEDGAFILGINAILFDEEALAKQYFERSAATHTNQANRDKAAFWAYLVGGEEQFLDMVVDSHAINLYSLYAKELRGIKISFKYENDKKTAKNQPAQKTAASDSAKTAPGAAKTGLNIVVPTPTKKSVKGYNPTDPFAWVKLNNKIAKAAPKDLAQLAQKYRTKDTIGEYTHIMHRLTKYKTTYFPLAHFDKIGTKDTYRQALLLALARQESLFVTSAVSTSYALGMMQFMPFLANQVGKNELKIANFDQDDMFKPATAYRLAGHHIDYLEQNLKNPIFIAYAYNGGLGFVKRMILKGELFAPNSRYNKFEPFLSLERVPYSESREYAKRVIANLVVYSTILGSNITILEFLQTLNKPGEAEYFRPRSDEEALTALPRLNLAQQSPKTAPLKDH